MILIILSACHTDNQLDVEIQAPAYQGADGFSRANTIPIAVIAGNRPRYLQRCLSSLFMNAGLDKENVFVFVDGLFAEPIELTEVFGVHGFQRFVSRECGHVIARPLPSGVSNYSRHCN
eukprot:Opistho-2@74192